MNRSTRKFIPLGRAPAALPLAFVSVLALAAAPALFAQGFGFDDQTAGGAAAQAVALGGAIDYSARTYLDPDDLAASAVDSLPSARLTLSAAGSGISAFARMKLDPETLANSPREALAEAWASADLGPLTMKGGLQRISWGVADSLRILDVISPRDYRSLAFAEVEDQYLPQASLCAKLALGGRTSLQAVWTPFFEGDRYAASGKWEPKKLKGLKAQAYASFYSNAYSVYYNQAYAAAYAQLYANYYAGAVAGGATAAQANDAAAAYAIANAASAAAANAATIEAQATASAESATSSFISYPDTASLEYSQAGARLAASLGGVDLGAQYWYGFDRRPSYDIAAAITSGEAAVSYDRLHHLGVDAAFALGGFNFRLEGAANLTDDVDGTDATVHNRSIAWAAGVDKDIGGFRLNLQGTQVYLLDPDGIRSANDIEYGDDEVDTKLALSLDRSFDRDRVKAQLAGIWELEQEDYMLSSSLTFTIADDLELRLAGRLFLGDANGAFGQYADNSYAELGMRYSF